MFHLRGNQRTPVAISILVKNPLAKAHGKIVLHDIGDWVGQRDDSFGEFISLGDKQDKDAATVFEDYCLGLTTNRDAWCYNASKSSLSHNMRRMVGFYNAEPNVGRVRCDASAHRNPTNSGDASGYAGANPTYTTHSRESYVAKARSGFFENKSSTRAMGTLDAFRECVKANVGAGQYWLNRLNAIRDSDFSAIITKIPDSFISLEVR